MLNVEHKPSHHSFPSWLVKMFLVHNTLQKALSNLRYFNLLTFSGGLDKEFAFQGWGFTMHSHSSNDNILVYTVE